MQNASTRELLMKSMGPFTAARPYYSNGKHQPPPPALLVDGEEEFEVEEILPHEPRSKTTGFLLGYRGILHPPSDKQVSQTPAAKALYTAANRASRQAADYQQHWSSQLAQVQNSMRKGDRH
ncbi:TPA: hypothetical protein ACH3X3_010357 [Trebouxia sp. C0006]